ncbi:hypothetical protein CBR_g3758 [Chara braunii]|uniref:Uncharacterized protein n=1 Tax=Chara braunii TaxID=69332 RepID=A0A388KG66_CHABU|nr:hypothetical protein CBR_g3758 [Chara braunii]|eukprot:GBG69060.1 hypothetical protein CBR_g3758 [Chara braunii]
MAAAMMTAMGVATSGVCEGGGRRLFALSSSANERAAVDRCGGASAPGVCERAPSSRSLVASGSRPICPSSRFSPFVLSKLCPRTRSAQWPAMAVRQGMSPSRASATSAQRRRPFAHSPFGSADHHHQGRHLHRSKGFFILRDVDRGVGLRSRQPGTQMDLRRLGVQLGQKRFAGQLSENVPEEKTAAAEPVRLDGLSAAAVMTAHVEIPTPEGDAQGEVAVPPNGTAGADAVEEKRQRRCVKGQLRNGTSGTPGKRRGRRKKEEEIVSDSVHENAKNLSVGDGTEEERVPLAAEAGERDELEAVNGQAIDARERANSWSMDDREDGAADLREEKDKIEEREAVRRMGRREDGDAAVSTAPAAVAAAAATSVEDTRGREEEEEEEEEGGGSFVVAGQEGQHRTPQMGEEDSEEDAMIGNLKMSVVCDRLIEVFLNERTTPDEWRKLLAFSDEWGNIRPHFYKRCKVRAAEEESIELKTSYLRLARRLEKVDQDMQRHDDLLHAIQESEGELDALVLRRRKDFTSDFFKHMKLVAETYYDDLTKQDEMTSLATKVLSAVENHDRMEQDQNAMVEAQEKFDDILNSPNLEMAKAKIDNLAANKQLDPALMMLITKAWVAAKESNMMKEEVKDIMYHLYMQARGNLQRNLPTEVRILRHLLSLEDPRERMAAMTEAFSPGDELQGEKVDMLYTTPQRLHRYVAAVLGAYEHPRSNPVFQAAKDMMKPMIIQRLQVMKDILEDQFL